MKREGRNGVLSSFLSIRTQSPPGPNSASSAFLRRNEGEKEGTQLSGLLTSAMAPLSPPGQGTLPGRKQADTNSH